MICFYYYSRNGRVRQLSVALYPLNVTPSVQRFFRAWKRATLPRQYSTLTFVEEPQAMSTENGDVIISQDPTDMLEQART